jgi:hypothetical protein
MFLVHRLSKVANNAIPQRAGPDIIVSVGRHEDCRNRMARIHEVPVELNARHCRHVDVGDQAGGLAKTRGCEEIGGGCEGLDSMAQRSHEPSHRLTKELIIFND